MKKTMNLSEKIINILIHPNLFFKKIKSETDIKKTFIYFLLINVLIIGIWRVKYLIIKFSTTEPSFNAMLGPNPYVSFWIAWIPIRIIGSLVMAYLFHLCVKLFTKKQHKFIDSFKVITYGETPYALLGWVSPIVFGIWSIFLYIKGITKLYDFTVFESICVLILAIIVSVIIMSIASVIIASPFVG